MGGGLRSRRRERDAMGVKGGEDREGVFPPRLTRGLVERCELPGWKRIWCILCHRTYLVKGKIVLSIDNCSDTNKPAILRISWKPQIKLHNNQLSVINSQTKINVILLLQQHWFSNAQAWLRFHQGRRGGKVKAWRAEPQASLTLTTELHRILTNFDLL